MYRQAVELMEAEVGNELVALDADAGRCFGFNEVATTVWRRLSEPMSFAQLRDGLLSEYEVSPDQCTKELQELLDEMVSKKLVEQTVEGTGGNDRHFRPGATASL